MINLTYFKFACGDENPLKLVKNLKYYEDGCSFVSEMRTMSRLSGLVEECLHLFIMIWMLILSETSDQILAYLFVNCDFLQAVPIS